MVHLLHRLYGVDAPAHRSAPAQPVFCPLRSALTLVMGQCRYFKSVRYLLLVFQNITISVQYFRQFTLRHFAKNFASESVSGF